MSNQVEAFYLRNEQEDSEGRLMKWDYVKSNDTFTKRGYASGDKLVLVNKNPDQFPDYMNASEMAEEMFLNYNRKGFDDREFDGPSMNIGDLVVFRYLASGIIRVFKCSSVGFNEIDKSAEIESLLV